MIKQFLNYDNFEIFTFQSGYIQMERYKFLIYSWNYFTFQSGYIQINMAKRVNEGFETLHSNLVIFKL